MVIGHDVENIWAICSTSSCRKQNDRDGNATEAIHLETVPILREFWLMCVGIPKIHGQQNVWVSSVQPLVKVYREFRDAW